MNFTRADFASREHNARNIHVRFYDVRTAACHKYRRVASLQIASVCASFYYVAHFHVSLIGFMTLEIYWVSKNVRQKGKKCRHVVFFRSEHFYAEIQNDLIPLSPRNMRGLKSLPHQSIYSQIIFSFFMFFLRYTLFSARLKSPSITPWCRYI